MKTSLSKDEFLDVCYEIHELYYNVITDYTTTKERYSQETYDNFLMNDYLYVGLAMCIYLDTVPYETLTDKAITAIMEMYQDLVAEGHIDE